MRTILLLVSVYSASLCEMTAQEDVVLKSYSFENAAAAISINDKPMAVFLWTDWCRFCNAMKRNTFTDSLVVQQLNASYYYIPFNAEQEEPVSINGKLFTFKPSGNNQGVHELATALTAYQQEPTFPSFFIINKDMEILYQQSGYISATVMTQLLKTMRPENPR